MARAATALIALLALSGGASAADPANTLAMAGVPAYDILARPPAGAMRVGGMHVRLESFMELRDGRVRAQLSFHNPDPESSASLTLKPDRASPEDADDAPPVRLANARGDTYRLVEISQFGQASPDTDWTAVPPGGATFMTATFAPEGAARGIQPFALSVPVRMIWRTRDNPMPQTNSFGVNFRGIRRGMTEAGRYPAPVERIEPVALRADPPTRRSPITDIVAAPPPPVAVPDPDGAKAAAFDDDLAPLVARMPEAESDSHRYLFAVGIDQYDDAPGVPFADRSAKLMSELVRKRYGVPAENITLLTGAEATGVKLLGRLNSLIQRLRRGDTVYFYYAGHGLTARDGKTVYVVPKDAVPGAFEFDQLALTSILRRFEESSASQVVAFLDTCFSGRVGRNLSLYPGVGPLIPTPLTVTPLRSAGKITMFLAGQGDQFANDYPERGHRLFSYFLMRGLLDDRNDDARDLNDFVTREVRRVSARRGAEYVQEPKLEGALLSLAAR